MGTENSDIADDTPNAVYNIALNRLLIEKYSGSQVNFYEELTLNGLTAGEEYAFQYLIDVNIRVADAYTEKILDPNNDPYIPDDTYPDLKAVD